jgi:hypothetical protein
MAEAVGMGAPRTSRGASSGTSAGGGPEPPRPRRGERPVSIRIQSEGMSAHGEPPVLCGGQRRLVAEIPEGPARKIPEHRATGAAMVHPRQSMA